MKIAEIQLLMRNLYFEKDKSRGLEKTVLWFVSEVGELADLIAKNKFDKKIGMNSDIDSNYDLKHDLTNELADCFAWLVSIANILNINIETAILKKYPFKCPKCQKNPCTCIER